MIKLKDILYETITQTQLKSLEQYADKLFAVVGIDVEFSKHFFDRVNDPRNSKPISDAELTDMFQKTYEKHGKKIAQLGPDAEAVIVDMQKDINIPFVLDYDPKLQQIQLVSKTIMRKKNFQTPNQKLPV
jgi:hypothetical protein